MLAGRLRECCQILLDLETTSALDVLGTPDDLKLRSCMTLFGKAFAPGNVFDAVLQKYFGAEKDPRTVQLLAGSLLLADSSDRAETPDQI